MRSWPASKDGSVAITAAVATTQEILYSEAVGGRFDVPAGSALTLLTWWHKAGEASDYEEAYDEDGVAVTQVVAADRSYPMKSALFDSYAVKAVGNAAGTIYLTLKSHS